MFFPENDVIFLNYASSAAALVFYLPACVHTLTESGKYIKIFEETQYLINTLYISFQSFIPILFESRCWI